MRRGSGSKRNRRYSVETTSHSAKICSIIATLPPSSTSPVAPDTILEKKLLTLLLGPTSLLKSEKVSHLYGYWDLHAY